MNKYIGSAELDFYKKNGYLLIKNFFNIDLIQRIHKNISNLNHEDIADLPKSSYAYLHGGVKKDEFGCGISYLKNVFSNLPSADQLFGVELLTSAARILSIDDPYYSEGELHVRHSNSPHKIPSHQDNFYFCLEVPIALTCYIYLTDQNRESGGLGFLAPQDGLTVKHEKSDIKGFSSYDPITEESPNKFQYPVTNIGDVIFHDCQTFHRADPNSLNFPSASISIRIFSRTYSHRSIEMLARYRENLTFNRGE